MQAEINSTGLLIWKQESCVSRKPFILSQNLRTACGESQSLVVVLFNYYESHQENDHLIKTTIMY